MAMNGGVPIETTIESRVQRLGVLDVLRVIRDVVWFVWVLPGDAFQRQLREVRRLRLSERRIWGWSC